MKNKSFTSEEINERTNLLFVEYMKQYQADKMSFAEYTLVESIIIKVQGLFDEKVNNGE